MAPVAQLETETPTPSPPDPVESLPPPISVAASPSPSSPSLTGASRSLALGERTLVPTPEVTDVGYYCDSFLRRPVHSGPLKEQQAARRMHLSHNFDIYRHKLQVYEDQWSGLVRCCSQAEDDGKEGMVRYYERQIKREEDRMAWAMQNFKRMEWEDKVDMYRSILEDALVRVLDGGKEERSVCRRAPLVRYRSLLDVLEQHPKAAYPRVIQRLYAAKRSLARQQEEEEHLHRPSFPVLVAIVDELVLSCGRDHLLHSNDLTPALYLGSSRRRSKDHRLIKRVLIKTHKVAVKAEKRKKPKREKKVPWAARTTKRL